MERLNPDGPPADPVWLWPPPDPNAPRPHTALATVAAALVILLAVFAAAEQRQAQQELDLHVREQLALLQLEALGRLSYFAYIFEEHQRTRVALPPLEQGPITTRVAHIILLHATGRKQQAKEAYEELRQLTQEYPYTLSPENQQLIELVRRLVEEERPTVSAEERELLRTQLRWFGDLYLIATGNDDPFTKRAVEAAAIRTALSLAAAVVVVAALFVTGLVAWPVMLVRWASRARQLHLRLSPVPSGYYLEAFSACLLFYFFFQIVFSELFGLPGVLMAQLLSLAGLVLATRSRAPGRVIRLDLGLYSGRGWHREIAAGVLLYAMLLPALAVGFVPIYLLHRPTPADGAGGSPLDPPDVPYHPVIRYMLDGQAAEIATILVMAAVMAPITEEIIFRGLLYRVFRGALRRWRRAAAVAASALVNGFLFAIIHPQDWSSYPVLTMIGAVFCVGREWRGSLMAPMVAHALHNGLILLLPILLLG